MVPSIEKEDEKEAIEKEREEKQAAMRREIMKIMMDTTLTEEEKSHKRQALMMGGTSNANDNANASASKKKKKKGAKDKEGSEEESEQDAQASEEEETFLDDTLKCAMCMNLCERPVTAPCQHNFCLVCFNKWRAQAKYKCPTCRTDFPKQFAQNPRINTALILAIRLAKNPPKDRPAPVERRAEEDRPDEAYVTDRAVRKGRANACSGRMMTTAPPDHFGPIGPEYDPERNQGIQVGEWWTDRLHARQWGAHRPHVAGIAGQSSVGAQSVVLSGGYEDDRDEGEWFLYTGSGGKDLSGNKRTNKVHSSDQKFDKMNKALLLSCTLGLPVRVVRSFKEKRSAYAPTLDTPVRYDGVYRILCCWRKAGKNEDQHLICRYLFVRADNSPAPWSSAEVGDQGGEQAIPKEAEQEIKEAKGQVYKISQDPYWAFLPEQGVWGWRKPPPASKRMAGPGRSSDPTKKLKKNLSEQEKVLKEFRCALCKHTLQDPLSTPCNHMFCKGCLEARFAGMDDVQPINAARTLRVRHVAKHCPCCKADLSSFMAVVQVNREMAAVIEKLQGKVAEVKREMEKAIEEAAAAEDSNEAEDEEEEEEEEEGDGEEEEEDAPGPSSRPAKTQKKQAASSPGAAVAPGHKAKASPSAPAPPANEAASSPGKAGPSGAPPTEAAANGHATANDHANGTSRAGPSQQQQQQQQQPPSTANGGPAANGNAPKPVPAYKYSKQLSTMQEQFPDMDEGLIKDILGDEEGDIPNARSKLRELRKGMQKAQAKSPRKPSIKGSKAAAENKTGDHSAAQNGAASGGAAMSGSSQEVAEKGADGTERIGNSGTEEAAVAAEPPKAKRGRQSQQGKAEEVPQAKKPRQGRKAT